MKKYALVKKESIPESSSLVRWIRLDEKRKRSKKRSRYYHDAIYVLVDKLWGDASNGVTNNNRFHELKEQ